MRCQPTRLLKLDLTHPTKPSPQEPKIETQPDDQNEASDHSSDQDNSADQQDDAVVPRLEVSDLPSDGDSLSDEEQIIKRDVEVQDAVESDKEDDSSPEREQEESTPLLESVEFSDLKSTTQIIFVPNAKKLGSQSGTRYHNYQKATSIEEARKLGATTGDLKYDLGRGFLKVTSLLSTTS